jgi:uncharacterized protein (TIGR03435 family)
MPARHFLFIPVWLILTANAQTQTPKFDVVAVKPCSGDNLAARGGRGSGSGGGRTPGRLDLGCQTVLSIIQTAYTSGMPPLPPIEGRPAWINSERYVIEAKAEGTPTAAIMKGLMLQVLLRDRFQLKTHLETKEVSGYALVAAKGGPKLIRHQEGSCVDTGLVAPLKGPAPRHVPGERIVICGANNSGKGTGPNVTLDVPGTTVDYFARTFLGIAFWDHPIVNQTGLTGLFDIHLEFSPDESTPGPPGMVRPPVVVNPDDSVRAFPSIFTALQQQLGLRLEPVKTPREVLIIDKVERPSEN